MKFLTFAAAALAPAVMAQNFQESCREIKGENQHLTAICKNGSGKEVCTELDLNGCILNVAGDLTYANDVMIGTGYPYYDEKNPQFTRTGCTGCSTAAESDKAGASIILSCEGCTDGRSFDAPPSSYDLSSVVRNEAGYLTCYRQRALLKDISYCKQ